MVKTDHVTRILTSRALIVSFQVTDVNDELPVFNKASVTVPVPEDVGTDTPLPGLSLEVSSTTNN